MTVGGESPAAAPLTPGEIDRLEWLLGTVEAKRVVGEPLSEDEAAVSSALAALNAAEADARAAFAAFYAGLPASGGGNRPSSDLPADVAACIGRWVETRRAWDETVTALLRRRPALPSPPVRTGPRLRATLPEYLRVPTALPARDALSLLFAPRLWEADTVGGAVSARRGETHVRVECDEAVGFGPEQAVHHIAKHGASVAQTFFALVGLWLEKNGEGASHETYLTAYASDLLRFQERKQTRRGGYHSADILAKGQDLYLLSRISIPTASVMRVDGGVSGGREVRALSLGRLLSLESLEMAQDTSVGGGGSMVRFRYHLGRQVWEWVGGDRPQYALVSGKLLTYHPGRQKYQVLLGFCLAYYDRAGNHQDAVRRISLPALLDLAGLPVPPRGIAEFLVSIEEALQELARDGVLPGLRLHKPADWYDLMARRNTRAIIAGSFVTFPRLEPLASLPAPCAPPSGTLS
jgi:hypothetical protein